MKKALTWGPPALLLAWMTLYAVIDINWLHHNQWQRFWRAGRKGISWLCFTFSDSKTDPAMLTASNTSRRRCDYHWRPPDIRLASRRALIIEKNNLIWLAWLNRLRFSSLMLNLTIIIIVIFTSICIRVTVMDSWMLTWVASSGGRPSPM